jgi:hypothetical protein
MSEHEVPRRGFYVLSEAWYGKAWLREADAGDEIMIGLYYPSGGTAGEFALRWRQVGEHLSPRLEIFSDTWVVLPHFADLLARLPELATTRPTAAQVVLLLKELQMADLTEREMPGPRILPMHATN